MGSSSCHTPLWDKASYFLCVMTRRFCYPAYIVNTSNGAYQPNLHSKMLQRYKKIRGNVLIHCAWLISLLHSLHTHYKLQFEHAVSATFTRRGHGHGGKIYLQLKTDKEQHYLLSSDGVLRLILIEVIPHSWTLLTMTSGKTRSFYMSMQR